MRILRSISYLPLILLITSYGQAKKNNLPAQSECKQIARAIENEVQEGAEAEKKLNELSRQVENNQKYINESNSNCQKNKNCQQMAMQLNMVRNQTTLLQGEKVTLAEKQVTQLKKIEELKAQLKEKCEQNQTKK